RFLLLERQPQISPLFPYTTLFRSELEPTQRAVYCGSIGYVSVTGALDTSIVTRTYLVIGRDVYFQVGGGIVADSDPAQEYRETRSEEHTSELQSRENLVCRLLLEK